MYCNLMNMITIGPPASPEVKSKSSHLKNDASSSIMAFLRKKIGRGREGRSSTKTERDRDKKTEPSVHYYLQQMLTCLSCVTQVLKAPYQPPISERIIYLIHGR